MFHATPSQYAWLLPGYPLDRLLYAGAFSPSFQAAGQLLLALGWLGGLAVAVYVVLHRTISRPAA
jgi:hypothetical protein